MARTASLRLRWLIVSLFLTTTAVVPLAYWLIPHVLRWHLLSKLTDADLAERELGLNYVVRRAADRPRVLQGAVRALDVGDEQNFLQIANALQRSGQWRYPAVGADPWLRWIDVLGRDSDAESRIAACQHVAQLADLADDPRPAAMLGRWLSDDSDEVRYNALIAAAELVALAKNRWPYESLIVATADDARPVIAGEAWLFIGLLELDADLPADWQTRPPYLAQAIAWANGLFKPQPPLVPADSTQPLQQLEAMPIGQQRVAIRADMTDTLRLAAVAVTSDPQPKDLLRVFNSPLPFVRDRACVVAAERFSREQNEALIGSLLSDYSDDAKCSGAILAGLTGLGGELLDRKMQDEDIWSVQQIHKLGLWMQGRLPQMQRQVALLLTRDDLPTTTILLAMLHKDRTAALDYILSPRTDEPQFSTEALNLPEDEGDQPVALIKLLIHYRWWHVLKRYLPDDAPPLWLWADDQLQQFQLDILRDWYLVNRHRQFAASRPAAPR